MLNNAGTRWLAVDANPLSQAVLQTLEMLDGSAIWKLVDPSLGFPGGAAPPEYCLCLTESDTDSFVLELLRNNVRAYGPPGGQLLIVWLLDPGMYAAATFEHLSAIVARGFLHRWKNSAVPTVSLATMIHDVLLPLESLGYLGADDSKCLQEYANLGSAAEHSTIALEVEYLILQTLESY